MTQAELDAERSAAIARRTQREAPLLLGGRARAVLGTCGWDASRDDLFLAAQSQYRHMSEQDHTAIVDCAEQLRRR